MEQLTFELAVPEPPTFANFVPGRNAEVVAALRQWVAGAVAETGVLLWGGHGSGRTHLLHAVAASASAMPGRGPVTLHGSAEAAQAEPPGRGSLVVIDDIHSASSAAQGRLFTLYNRLRETGGQLLVAADAPPDPEKALALTGYAQERGVPLSGDVVAWLLAHGRRDMSTLTATLHALDRYSLASKRPITVPLAREWSRKAGDLFGDKG